MTSQNPCPAWCSDKYPADDPLHMHRGPLMSVPVGRAKSDLARPDLPSVLVISVLPDEAAAPPFLLVFTTASSGLPPHVLRRDFEGLSEVIETLAAATPAQHREVAAAIRQAGALIESEVK